MTPLLICGPPRSGTRFMTNVLNAAPNVRINGEIQPEVFRSLVATITSAERVYGKSSRKGWSDRWEEKKRRFMYDAWASLNKGRGYYPSGSEQYFGYKTPGHEHYFDFYNRFFSEDRPKYICCVRSFEDHLLSVQARWPHRPIYRVARQYTQSLKQIHKMVNERPHDVLVFVLDDYKVEGYSYMERRILGPLGIRSEQVEQRAGKGAANTAEHLGVTRKERLSTIQRFYLKANRQIANEFERLRAASDSSVPRES